MLNSWKCPYRSKGACDIPISKVQQIIGAHAFQHALHLIIQPGPLNTTRISNLKPKSRGRLHMNPMSVPSSQSPTALKIPTFCRHLQRALLLPSLKRRLRYKSASPRNAVESGQSPPGSDEPKSQSLVPSNSLPSGTSVDHDTASSSHGPWRAPTGRHDLRQRQLVFRTCSTTLMQTFPMTQTGSNSLPEENATPLCSASRHKQDTGNSTVTLPSEETDQFHNSGRRAMEKE